MSAENFAYPLPKGIPMTHENVWRAASYMIDLYGEDAAIHAGMHADKLLDLGDIDGFQVWLEVKRAIDRLQQRPSNEAAN